MYTGKHDAFLSSFVLWHVMNQVLSSERCVYSKIQSKMRKEYFRKSEQV